MMLAGEFAAGSVDPPMPRFRRWWGDERVVVGAGDAAEDAPVTVALEDQHEGGR